MDRARQDARVMETRTCRKNRNTRLRHGDRCVLMKTDAFKTSLPLVLKFYPAAPTCENALAMCFSVS